MTNANDKFSRLAALKPALGSIPRPAALRTPEETDPIAHLLGAGIAHNHYGEHLAIRNWFSTPEFAEPSPVALELLTSSASLKRRNSPGRLFHSSSKSLGDPQKWLFLDTETTGLAGGTGTYAFLVGLAWWDAGGLQIEQLFLRDFSEEHSLLFELSSRLAERPVLVTFNGKTFDWPLLQSRFTMTRAIKPPKLDAHLDLLHPARALWKLRLGSVRLVELERRVLDAERLGWHRGDDIASALIPQYYFDYLRGGVAKPLAGVVKHNQMDLRGLAALFGKINSLLDERGSLAAEESLDLFGLSKFLDRRGHRERALSACEQAIQSGLPAEFRPRATRELALMAKRRGDHTAAAQLWNQLTSDPVDGIEAAEQLAIYHERRAKNLPQALEFAQLAIGLLQRQQPRTRDPFLAARHRRRQEKLMCRAARLQHRITKGKAAANAPLLSRSAAANASG